MYKSKLLNLKLRVEGSTSI